MEVGPAGQVGHLVRRLVAWALQLVPGPARIRWRNSTGKSALAKEKNTNLVKTLTAVSWLQNLKHEENADADFLHYLITHAFTLFNLYFLGKSTVYKTLFLSGDIPYKDIGCYIDTQRTPRPLPELLFSDRDKISWKKWKSFMSDLICRYRKLQRNVIVCVIILIFRRLQYITLYSDRFRSKSKVYFL